MKKFGNHHVIYECTAIAGCDSGEEQRQNALYTITYGEGGEKIEFVIFGFEMPQSEDEWETMCEEESAWENDWEVLKTIRDIC